MMVDVAAFDGMDELDAVGPVEVLRRAEFDVNLVTLTPRTSIRCAHGLVIVPDGVTRPDAAIVIFPGGGWNARAAQGVAAEIENRRWSSVIESASSRNAVLASVCTGALILASAGALRGRRATTHHSALADLAKAGAIVVTERVVDDGDRITAGGVTSGIDLGLWIVERFAGPELAEKIASSLEYRAGHHAC